VNFTDPIPVKRAIFRHCSIDRNHGLLKLCA
jgi:hypothetical protein